MTIEYKEKVEKSISYIHEKPLSFQAKLIELIISLIGIKKYVERKIKKKNFSQKVSSIPRSLKKKFNINLVEINNRKLWVIKDKEDKSEKVILYLHGGAYIFNIANNHWQFAEQLIKSTKATIIIPDYPLAPNSNALDAYDFLDSVYEDLLKGISPNNLIFLGDSAGAGLAFGFAQKLKKDNSNGPSQIILLSPWLDITMGNADIKVIEPNDNILSVKGLKLAGKSFAADFDEKDFRVSPIYGNLSGLGKISIFIGTHDLFLADSRKLKFLLEEKNIPVNFFEYPKMFHDWPIITSLEESKLVIKQIESIIKHEYPN